MDCKTKWCPLQPSCSGVYLHAVLGERVRFTSTVAQEVCSRGQRAVALEICTRGQRAVMGADVVPIFLAVIEEHRNPASRDKLTYALFNLVKKPTPGQRHLIADSCAHLAGRIGPSRTAEELLPQCWEQVGLGRQGRQYSFFLAVYHLAVCRNCLDNDGAA